MELWAKLMLRQDISVCKTSADSMQHSAHLSELHWPSAFLVFGHRTSLLKEFIGKFCE